MQQNTPNITHPLYQEISDAWTLTSDLMGGTRAMREAREKWLPREEREKKPQYEARLSRSVLFPCYAEAVETLSGRPFTNPVQLKGKAPLPEPLDQIERSCDDECRDLTQFARHLMKIGIDRGRVHILVDSPNRLVASKAEERALGLKPYFVCIDPVNLINWHSETAPNGEQRFTMIAIREMSYQASGEFGVELVEQVRVIRPDTWAIYREISLGKETIWTKADEGPWPLGEISLVTIYFDKEHGFMNAVPPMEGLAWLNLAHWQSMSDHRNNLRFARSGTVYAAGLSQEEMDNEFVWGVNRIIRSTNPQAQFGILEHTGSAVTVGENELRHLEEMMQVLGKAPLMVKSWGNETAMGQAIDEGKASCDLQAWVRAVEWGLRRAYEYAAKWRDFELADDFGVDVYDDFAMVARSAEDVQTILELMRLGFLTRRSGLRQVQVRGVLTEDLVVDREIEDLKKEGPALGMMGREPVSVESAEQPVEV